VLLDWSWMGTYLALGAAVENMVLAAGAAGIASDVRAFPVEGDPRVVADLAFSRAPVPTPSSPLVEHIGKRATNRRLGPRVALDREHERALAAAAADAGGRLQIMTDADRLERIGRVLGAGDRIRFLSERLHHELMREIRWSPEEVETTRDGIDLATMELSRTDLATLRLSRSWNNLLFIREIGGGRALEKSARDGMAAASASCLLTFPGTKGSSYFHGGRALQRVWLTATKLGLAFQPTSAIVYLWARLERGGGEGLAADEVARLHELRQDFRGIFDVAPDQAEVMLFRVSIAAAPSARSLRRAVDDVLVFE
jgi:hypothetical protein